MIRQTTGTIFARVFITLMNLLVMMIAGHRLGAHGLGNISLVVLGITFVMLIGNLACGGAVVYLSPRVPTSRILALAYLWTVITMGIAMAVFSVIAIVPREFSMAVALLAGIQCLYSTHLNLLLGRERIMVFNLIGMAQALVLLAVFLVLTDPSADGTRPVTTMAYVYASFAAFATTLVLSSLALLAGRRQSIMPDGNVKVLPTMLRQGGMIQVTNTMQLFAYRLSYWLIEHFRGTPVLGVYALGNQLAESAWLAPRSLGTVLYSRVSNTVDPDRQRELTILSFKVAVIFALAVVLVLCLLPGQVYSVLFGDELIGLPSVLWILAPGIVAMAASQAFSHYFSGTARNVHNLAGSGIAMVFTVIIGLLAIPGYGMHGAAVAATMAYSANVIYQAIVFLRVARARITDLLPHSGDMDRMRRIWRDLFPR